MTKEEGMMASELLDENGYAKMVVGDHDEAALVDAEQRGYEAAVADAARRRRAMSIGPQDVFLLDQWGRQLYEAFGEYPYLVGSVARAEDVWRDVDVRLMLDAEAYTALTSDDATRTAALNLAFTLWGRHVTGLPIDFQFQQTESANEDFGGEIRNPMGPRSRTRWQ